MSQEGSNATDTDVVAIANGWLEETGDVNRTEAQPFYNTLDDLVRYEPETAWNIVQTMMQRDVSDEILSNIAAGPVEDILAKHGPIFIGRIELAARQKPVFRKMLGGVWRNQISEDIWLRVQKIAGPPF